MKRQEPTRTDRQEPESTQPLPAPVLHPLSCLRCFHTWYPRGPERPKNCANRKCNSPYWDRPRQRG